MGRRKPFLIEEVSLHGMGAKGKAVGRSQEGQVVFVEKAVPGDVVDIWVTKKKKSFLQGRVSHYHSYSPDRVEPVCEHFGVCGGCKWQHISYEAQLRHKEDIVHAAIQRIAKINIGKLLPIVPSTHTFYYRNKMEFAFSNKKWLPQELLNTDVSNEEDVLGFHPPGAFSKVINIDHCHLQGGQSNEIRNFVRDKAKTLEIPFFDIQKQEGLIRHLLIRTSTLGQTMLLFSFYHEDKKNTTLLDAVIEAFPQLTSVHYCINPKANDFILDLEVVHYHGQAFIQEAIGDITYKIGVKSFFQTNPKQAKILYDLIVENAALTGTENVYDLYTGTGSIACYLAAHAKKVVGIEEVAAAVEDAQYNASVNGIENVTFYAGDVKDILTPDFANMHGKPDILITDPPRAGMHPKVIKIILELEAPKLVYVSCNPATQARDLELLQEKYNIESIQPVDMFPHTFHIESIAKLSLKK